MSTAGMTFNRKVTKRAKGMREGLRLKIAVSFPRSLFREIEQMACAQDIAFQEQVSRLCRAAIAAERAKEGA